MKLNFQGQVPSVARGRKDKPEYVYFYQVHWNTVLRALRAGGGGRNTQQTTKYFIEAPFFARSS